MDPLGSLNQISIWIMTALGTAGVFALMLWGERRSAREQRSKETERKRHAQELEEDKPKAIRIDDRTTGAIWESLCDLHDRCFPDKETADRCEDIHRWISEWSDARRVTSHPEMDEILLAVVWRNTVLGYLYGQYYRDFGYAFISYVGSDRRRKEAINFCMPLLLSELHSLLTREYSKWTAIVGELEEVKSKTIRGRVKRVPHAPMLFEHFRQTAAEMREIYASSVDFYSLCFDYWQPVLRPEDIPAGGHIVKTQGLKQWILYAPNIQTGIDHTDDGSWLSRHEAERVLDFIFTRLYRDAFKSEDYQHYLQSSLDDHRSRLRGRVKLATNWREAAGLPL